MKKILFALLTSAMTFGQSVSLTQNTSYGDNCGQNRPVTTITINGDINLNGFTLTLRNVNLIVTGNLNGGGSIVNCGNPNIITSSVCVNGAIQNNPNLNGLSCTLSAESFTFTSDNNGLKYDVFDLQGRLILFGITENNTFETLPQKTILIFRVEGFKPIKIYRN